MDPILYWNDVALEANKISHTNGKKEQTGPVLSARALAIVHLAMHDAFAGVSGNVTELPPYLNPLPAVPAGASLDAAVAAAAHATLAGLFPSQKAYFDARHAAAGLSGPGLNEGSAFGLLVASAILKDRKDDPGVSDDGFTTSIAHASHRADPDGPDQGAHGPFYGANSKGFAITARHELAAPPDPGSAEFRRALREVRSRGVAPELLGAVPSSARRTNDQTVIGLYWAYDGAVGVGTPPRLYNQVVREIATRRSPPNTPAQNARLFALVNVAMADAGILAWDQKYVHNLCRPVVGIRERDVSMGPAGVPGNNIDDDTDVTWLPMGAPNTNVVGGKNGSPPFPAYPSGHATFGAAAFHMTRLFYEPSRLTDRSPDSLFNGLHFVSDELNGVNKDVKGAVRPRHVRNFPQGLWQMIEENGRSRVYLGVHYVFDAFVVDSTGRPDLDRTDADGRPFGGVPLGLKIAEDIFTSNMTKSTVGPRV